MNSEMSLEERKHQMFPPIQTSVIKFNTEPLNANTLFRCSFTPNFLMPIHYSGAPSQTPRALPKPGSAPREDYVCNLSGERLIVNTDSNILDLVAKIIPHQDNAVLCNEVNEKVVQHFVHCIESHGKHVQYLRFLQTIVHTESQFIRRCQDLVMQVCACLE